MAGIPIQHPAHEFVRPKPVVQSSSEQAFWILRCGYTALPIIAGVDKFSHLLANWDLYLAPAVTRIVPRPPHNFMLIVGAIEIVAGLVVAVAPRVGAWVVAAWLAGIISNLMMTGGFYDVALRDFGLMLGAVALGRLSATHAHCAVTPPSSA